MKVDHITTLSTIFQYSIDTGSVLCHIVTPLTFRGTVDLTYNNIMLVNIHQNLVKSLWRYFNFGQYVVTQYYYNCEI